jgi:prolipoprotein diacylglyceryltransferase
MKIGSIPIYSYGVMIVITVVVCAWVVSLELRRKDLNNAKL